MKHNNKDIVSALLMLGVAAIVALDVIVTAIHYSGFHLD